MPTSANWFQYILLPCPITVYQCPRSKPIGDTPPACLTNPAPRLLTVVENRFAAKIDRVIDRPNVFNFVSSVHLRSNRGLNNRIGENLVTRQNSRSKLSTKKRKRENKSRVFMRPLSSYQRIKFYLLPGFFFFFSYKIWNFIETSNHLVVIVQKLSRF